MFVLVVCGHCEQVLKCLLSHSIKRTTSGGSVLVRAYVQGHVPTLSRGSQDFSAGDDLFHESASHSSSSTKTNGLYCTFEDVMLCFPLMNDLFPLF